MEYAVVRLGGKQYKVSKGDVLEVDREALEPNGQFVIDDVLLWVLDGKIKIGNPKIADVKVRAKVVEQKKGEKIRVAKFKAKVRYRRAMGFRSLLTKLQILEIEQPNDDQDRKPAKVVVKKEKNLQSISM